MFIKQEKEKEREFEEEREFEKQSVSNLIATYREKEFTKFL